MLWSGRTMSGLGTKTAGLGLEKQHGFGLNKCANVS